MYRYPMALNANYIKKFLNIGNQTKINSIIESNTNNMIAAAASISTKSTLFDSIFNADTIYYPYYSYSFLSNDSLKAIDLLYTMVSAVSSLNTPAIDLTNHEYERFNAYLKPAYDTMMNTTKYNLH